MCTVPLEMNGIATVIMSHFRSLNSKVNFDFLVNECANALYEKEIVSRGSKVYIVDRKRNTVRYIIQLYKILKDGKYDVIHVHGNSATMALELMIAKKMHVNNRITHCHNTKCKHVFIHKLLKNLFQNSYTKGLACSVEAGNWIFGENNFDVINNGIDIKNFKFDDNIRNIKRKELGLENTYVIGHVGLFNEQKNHKRLFEIFAEFKKKCNNAKLLCITGSKQIPQYILDELKTNNIEEDTIILLDRNDVNELYQAMDFFLFPSNWEGLGIVAIEAQASGLFCLASTNVPNKIDITNNVLHKSLKENNERWCDEMMIHSKDKINRVKENEIVSTSDFNIEKVSLKMYSMYKS